MKINWNDGEYHKAAKVTDANGTEHKRVLSCDTETGEIECMRIDNQGKIVQDQNGLLAVRDIVFAKPPLNVEWIDG